VEEGSGKVQTSLKPGFKAALGVGIGALGLASGGVGALAGASLASTLATTALTSSAVSFVSHGLEATMNHESINLSKILKDTRKSLAVAGIGQIGGDLGAFGSLARSVAASTAIRGGSPLSHLASQGLQAISAELAGYVGQYHKEGLDPILHKGIHGALALSSTLASQALKGRTLDFKQAYLAAGITMAGETAASNLGSDFSLEDKQKLIAGLRTFSAASLVLQGANPDHIDASDAALDNALQNNFAFPLAAPAATGLLKGACLVGGALLAAWTGEKVVKAVKENSDEKKRAEVSKREGEKQQNGGGPNGKGPKGPKGPKDTGTGGAIAGTVAAKQAKNAFDSTKQTPKTSVAAKRKAVQKAHKKAKREAAKTEYKQNEVKKAQEERDRHNRELVRDKNAPAPENLGRTNLEKADFDRMRLRGQTKPEKVHPEFEKKVKKAMQDSGKKAYRYKKELPDGRKRFYKDLTPSENPNNKFTNGGSNYVKEINPRTGKERGWQESYQKPSAQRPKEPRGEALQNDLHTVQVHPKPKNPDGTIRDVQHYPHTKGDIENFEAGKIPSLNTKPNLLDKK
jgi:hypothetical protein